MTTICLVPMAVDAVEIPVIAGGIADGRGVAAAFALELVYNKTVLSVLKNPRTYQL